MRTTSTLSQKGSVCEETTLIFLVLVKRLKMPTTTTTTTQGNQEEAGVNRGWSSSTSKCQDCGNQAKKECSYWRCRTCCKNKGFHCQTHVKSTWIPVDRRRHRDHQHPSPSSNPLFFHGDTSKRHKPYSGADQEQKKFPASTNSMAIFRCVQVRSMDDTVNEVAYQTSVNIGGHVFSGLLYDQGPAPNQTSSVYAAATTNKPSHNNSPAPLDHNLRVINNSSASTTHQTHHHHYRHHHDAAIMAPLSSSSPSASASAPPPHHDEPNFLTPPYPFPLTSFRPGMPYFSYPKP